MITLRYFFNKKQILKGKRVEEKNTTYCIDTIQFNSYVLTINHRCLLLMKGIN